MIYLESAGASKNKIQRWFSACRFSENTAEFVVDNKNIACVVIEYREK